MNRLYFYILDDDGNPAPVENSVAWGDWFNNSFETEERNLAMTFTNNLVVSTVFLGLDHNFSGVGPPILWETMVFEAPDPSDELLSAVDEFGQVRYTSKEKALEGHAKMVERVKNSVVVEMEKKKDEKIQAGSS